MDNVKKHTAGPWTAELIAGQYRIIGPRRRAVAETIVDFEGDSKLNAQLIASAPELVAALEHACHVLTADGTIDQLELEAPLADLVMFLQLTLAKATEVET